MTNSYFISIFLHAGFVIAAFLVTVPVLEKLEDKQITVELIEPEALPAESRSQVAAPKVEEVADQRAEMAQQQALPAKSSSTETAEIAE